jgi:hypothetical protein
VNNTNHPLWEAMHCAYSPHRAPGQWRLGYAAMLRAIADEMERRGDKKLDLDPGETADWLRAEADRAEAGQ